MARLSILNKHGKEVGYIKPKKEEKIRLEAQKKNEEEIESARICVLESRPKCGICEACEKLCFDAQPQPCPECGCKAMSFHVKVRPLHPTGWDVRYLAECRGCGLYLNLRDKVFKMDDSLNDIQILITSWNGAVNFYESERGGSR